MSFQTIQCPQCGKKHIEYPDPLLKVTCNDCKHIFSPFKHLKEVKYVQKQKALAVDHVSTSVPESAKVNKTKEQITKRQTEVNEQSSSNKIFKQIVKVDNAIGKLKNGLEWTQAGEVVLQEIKAELSVLGNTLFERLKISTAQLKNDLKPTFTYAPLSNHPQNLGLILAYFYTKIEELGNEACIQLLGDSEHWLFSLDVIDFYKLELQRLNVKI